ncbi:MAG: hypothetical protein ACSLEW_07860 [Nocardioides sp.]
MSVSRTVLTAVAAWLAVVAVGSVLVWSVISRAGDVEPGSQTALPAATRTPAGESAQPPTPAGESAQSPTPAGESAPPPTPAGEPAQSPTPTPSTPSSSTASPDREAEQRTWQGPGGYVSVECRGQEISLVAAQADAGFVVEVDHRGPDEVKVAFEGQGEEGRETEVSAECRAAVPEFEVDAEE